MSRGELSSGKHAKRHPLDWYVEEQWCTEQVIEAIGFDGEIEDGAAIWDPACGMGNVLAAFQGLDNEHYVIGSDVVDNVDCTQFMPNGHGLNAPDEFFIADFLALEKAPAERCTIFSNPPYSYRKGILEAFVRQALRLATHKVCMIVPNKWLASQTRFRLFMRDHVPSHVLHYCQRPSMPPGDRIALMGNRAFRGGMIDYACVVWDAQGATEPGDTRTIWLPPLGWSEPALGADDLGDEF